MKLQHILVIAGIFLVHFCSAIIWDKTTYPSPFGDITNKCRRNKINSWVCDPDSVIFTSDGDYIDSVLKKIRTYTISPCHKSNYSGYNVGVAIVDRITGSGQIKDRASSFAFYIREITWSLPTNPASCDDSVLMMLFKYDRYVYISVGEKARGLLPDGATKLIVGEMRNELKAGKYGTAMKTGVGEIYQYLSKSKIYKPRKTSTFPVWAIALLIPACIFGCVCCVIICVKCPCCKEHCKDVTNEPCSNGRDGTRSIWSLPERTRGRGHGFGFGGGFSSGGGGGDGGGGGGF